MPDARSAPAGRRERGTKNKMMAMKMKVPAQIFLYFGLK
jgi:hypothetical protein